jgi:hypothetical protein
MNSLPTLEVSNSEAVWSHVSQLNRILFNACVRQARACGDAGNFEEVLQWCSVAAWSASGQGWFGEVSSRDIEQELIRAAQQLPVPKVTPPSRKRPRWLHVFTEAYATLGHTNLCRRWIQFDSDVTHDVILLAQIGEGPANLEAAAKQSGGRCVVLDPTTSLLQRAAELRNYAWENADVVLLHTHPDEVLGVVAFGIPGGPVVVVVNHADHVFWLGCAVADQVLEIRRSGHLWTKQLRGVARSTILPIPLAQNEPRSPAAVSGPGERETLRRSLGIPDSAVMLLTVGSAAKFEPGAGMDFIATAKEILRECDNAYLVAVGPEDEGCWREAKQATNGRMMPLGYQQDSTLFCRSADLYLEGFPLGSLTALLEAGQVGLMCVRAPSPLPFCSDSGSLDSVPQAADLKDYVVRAVALIKNAAARIVGGKQLRQAIEMQHCGAGWLARLREIRSLLPTTHQVHLDFQPASAPAALQHWFLKYMFRRSSAPDPVQVATRVFIESWSRVNSQPQLDAQLWGELQASQAAGNHEARAQSVVKGRSEWMDLQRLNRKIATQGIRNRFLARARVALSCGQRRQARRAVYQCLWASPTSCWDLRWLKQFARTHLSPRLIARLQALLPGRSRRASS